MIGQKLEKECGSVLSSSEWVVAPGSVNKPTHRKKRLQGRIVIGKSNWRLESPESKQKSPEQELYLVFRN